MKYIYLVISEHDDNIHFCSNALYKAKLWMQRLGRWHDGYNFYVKRINMNSFPSKKHRYSDKELEKI